MKNLILGIAILTSFSSLAEVEELKNNYICSADKSVVSYLYEFIGNTTTFNGNRGYYSSPIQLGITKKSDKEFSYEFLGEQAFCNPNEQCAGLYVIASGTTEVAFNDGIIKAQGNPMVSFRIDTVTKKCEARILDFRIKKKLTKFKGQLY